jgi:glycosyltransferase involved in cell wall biosynthesis
MLHIGLIGPVPEAWGGPPRGGGVSSYVQGLASGIAELGVQVSLLGDNSNAGRGPFLPGLPAHIQFHPMFRLAGRFAPQALLALGPVRLARMTARLMLHRTIRIPWCQRLRYVDRAANYDLFLCQAKPQLLHVAHAEFRQFLTQQVAGASLPVIASVLSATALLRPVPDWLRQMTIQNYNLASRLIVCSNYVKSCIVPFVVDPCKMVLIPNGTDTDRFQPGSQERARAVLGLDPKEFVVLYTGSLVKPKGVDVLLRAFAYGAAQRANARLVFVGAGPEATALKNLAAELGVAQQTTLVGYRPPSELPDWYTACDVFALPSQSEGLSISLLEAMASGRLVVTTYPEIGSHDAVEDGVSGFLFRSGDVDALSTVLCRLAHSPEQAVHMGLAARRKVECCFSWQVIAKQVVDVYQAVTSETRERRNGSRTDS